MKESLRSTKRGSLQALAVLWEQTCRVQELTNIGSDGKSTLSSLALYNTNAIAINKLCKLNFRYYTMYFSDKSAAGLSGRFNGVSLKIKDFSLLINSTIIDKALACSY